MIEKITTLNSSNLSPLFIYPHVMHRLLPCSRPQSRMLNPCALGPKYYTRCTLFMNWDCVRCMCCNYNLKYRPRSNMCSLRFGDSNFKRNSFTIYCVNVLFSISEFDIMLNPDNLMYFYKQNLKKQNTAHAKSRLVSF